jgi:hypothetical protein
MDDENKTPDTPPADQPNSNQNPTGIEPASDPQIINVSAGNFYAKYYDAIFQSTGTVIASTISVADALSQSMKDWNQNAIAGLQPGLDEYFTQKVEPIINAFELKLQETQQSLISTSKFIKDNESYLTNLISVEGKMKGLEKDVSSAERRIGILEEHKNTSWIRSSTTWLIIFSVMTGCAGVIGVAIALIALFKK